jgi:fucose permease
MDSQVARAQATSSAAVIVTSNRRPSMATMPERIRDALAPGGALATTALAAKLHGRAWGRTGKMSDSPTLARFVKDRMGHPVGSRLGMEFRRDRLTWIVYVVIAWYAYLQAAPGLVIPHLRDELDLNYSAGGLHVAAFAAGSMVAGLISARLERVLGRRTLLWSAAVLMGAGAIGLTQGRVAEVTVGSVLMMGIGGGLLLVTIQAALADNHGERRGVALTEANVAASIGYVMLIGALSLTAALQAGWRVALLASLTVPALCWWSNRRVAIDAPPPSRVAQGRIPGVIWIAAGILFCTTAAEWSIIAWGATFVQEATEVSTDIAVALMAGYFGTVVVGRTLGSRLARRHDPARLLALALAVAAAGFAILWPSTGPAQALVGLLLLGIGLGNLYPMGTSVAIALAPAQAVLASGRVVVMTSFAGFLAPLTVGPLADATSLTTALVVVPVLLVLAAAGLALVRRLRSRDASPLGVNE